MNGALFAEFPPVSTAEWETALAKDLKGADPKKLIWKTEDGLDVKPFYRMEDSPGLPAFSDFPKGWRICAEADGYDAAMDAIARGAQAILLRDVGANVDELLRRLPLDRIEVHIRSDAADDVFPVVEKYLPKLRGSLDHQPPAQMKKAGLDFVPFVIDGDRFATFEPTATQELALMLALGSEFLVSGAAPDSIAFDFPIGTNYFFEIAKLRAARLLWPRVVSAYQPSARPLVRIYAHTGEWNKTIYDPHVNLLRATTGAMAAVIGGAELLTITDFNSAFAEPNAFSRRMAVNTQLVLREEAHFDELSDAAAGSWYIDSLTDQVAQQAWKIFQAIEAQGGYDKAQELIQGITGAASKGRRERIAQRRKLFTGVNAHANPAERELDQITRPSESPRGAALFEQLRLNAEAYTRKEGRAPLVFLLRWGDAKMRRARAEFSGDFFACGGFEIADPPAFSSIEDAVRAINGGHADLVILCSSDAEYAALAEPICQQLVCPVIVAGYPKDNIERLKEAGVADFIHIRSNALETLAGWQQKLGIGA